SNCVRPAVTGTARSSEDVHLQFRAQCRPLDRLREPVRTATRSLQFVKNVGQVFNFETALALRDPYSWFGIVEVGYSAPSPRPPASPAKCSERRMPPRS